MRAVLVVVMLAFAACGGDDADGPAAVEISTEDICLISDEASAAFLSERYAEALAFARRLDDADIDDAEVEEAAAAAASMADELTPGSVTGDAFVPFIGALSRVTRACGR